MSVRALKGIGLRFIPLILGLSLISGCKDESLVRLEDNQLVIETYTLNVTIQNYCAREGFYFLDIYALNFSYEIRDGALAPDFDRDGLPNTEDKDPDLGLSMHYPDSNGDGYSDLLIALAGFDRESQARLPDCIDLVVDTDLDGLTDCEENNITHSDPQNWDSDNDTIPDYLEIRFGMNPLDAADRELNPSGDGISNIVKIKTQLPIHEVTSDATSRYRIAYNSEPLSPDCQNIRITNIPLADVSNGNIIKIFIFEKDAQAKGSMRTMTYVRSKVLGTSTQDLVIEYNEGVPAEWSTQI